MQITIFGLIWIAVILCVSFSKNIKGLIFVTLLSMVFQCNNVVFIGETAIGAQIFTVSFAAVRCLLCSKANNRDRISKKVCSIFFCIIVAIILSIIVNQSFMSSNMIAVLMVVVYFVFSVILKNKELNIDLQWLEKVEDAIIISVLIIGVLQVLCKSGLTFLNGFLTTFVYNDALNTDVIFHYKDTSAFYSTFMEPSYCGAFLVASFSSVLFRKKVTCKNILLSIVLILAILLTRSSTAYGGLAIFVIIALFVNSEKKVYKFFIPIIILIAFVVCMFNMDLLNEVIFDKIGSSGSYTVRTNWNQKALEAFESSPWVGVGFKNIRGSSIYLSLLGEIGLIGIIPYSLFIVFLLANLLVKKAEASCKARMMYVFMMIVCQIIACPDLNFSPFWLGIYFLMLSLSANRKVISTGGKLS